VARVTLDSTPSLLRYQDGSRSLLLKRARVADAEALMEALEESLPELREFMSWAHRGNSLEIQRDRLKETEAQRDSGGEICFHIFEKEGGPFLGSIGLIRARVINPLGLELGYWTRTSAAGRGLMTLAARCLYVLAFDYFGCERLQCFFDVNNKASERVSQKTGFTEEARLRNFGPLATPETMAQGDRSGPIMVLAAGFPEDRAEMDWYSAIAKNLEVLDEGGEIALPEFAL